MQTQAETSATQERAIAPEDMMAVALSRLLRDGETVFHGVASPLPMVAILLAKATHAPDLLYLNITGSVDPSPSALPRTTVDPALLAGTRAVITLAEAFDLSARGELDTVFLSGVQIDAFGRINMSAIGDPAHPKVRLPGGAGSAFLMSTANRIVLWRTRHDPRTFVERLGFTTGSGNVDRVVTPLCVFRREHPHPQPLSRHPSLRRDTRARGASSITPDSVGPAAPLAGRLVLESIHPYSSGEEVAAQTGFVVDVAGVPITPPPTPEELAALDRVDPERIRRTEFGG